jgi:SAM-dependent methyltransferase
MPLVHGLRRLVPHPLARLLRRVFPARATPSRRATERVARYAARHAGRFGGAPYLAGRCTICGQHSVFFCPDQRLYRESLHCAECGGTSRYRSISRGVLRAVRELTGVEAPSIAELSSRRDAPRVRYYDTQVPFSLEAAGYRTPELLGCCGWIDVSCSLYKPGRPPGEVLGPGWSNQNLEQLTYEDGAFDVVVTSDVMEHVRLADRAHREIARVLRPGGVYVFTVPCFRNRTTLVRVGVEDPADPSRDVFLLEPEYHGDGNSPDGRALAYRTYGTDLDDELGRLGFEVEYTRQDFPEQAIMSTELFYCRRR